MSRELFRFVQDRSTNVLELSIPAGVDVSEFDRINQVALSELDTRAAEGWVLDMTQCAYVGSAALGFMINVRQRVKKADGLLVLCGVSSQILATLRASSLGRFFIVVEDRKSAAAMLAEWRKLRKTKKA